MLLSSRYLTQKIVYVIDENEYRLRSSWMWKRRARLIEVCCWKSNCLLAEVLYGLTPVTCALPCATQARHQWWKQLNVWLLLRCYLHQKGAVPVTLMPLKSGSYGPAKHQCWWCSCICPLEMSQATFASHGPWRSWWTPQKTHHINISNTAKTTAEGCLRSWYWLPCRTIAAFENVANIWLHRSIV